MKTEKLDGRYTVTLEWCGDAKLMYIARFCGEWIGKADSWSDAEKLAHSHNKNRFGDTADAIVHGMARAFFASAWADMAEETGNSERISNGVEIMDVMPSTVDPAAVHAASTLRMDMECVNGKTIAEIYRTAESMPTEGADRTLTPELFGHYCAMQAMGHGVGLESFGDAVHDAVTVPYVEFGSHSLERDYFTTSEEE